MNPLKRLKLIAFLALCMLQTMHGYCQDSTFTLPKGFIDSMSTREAERGHITYLKTYYTQCMIGDSLDINCPKIKQVVTLNIPFENRMVDLSWIKHFDNLTELTVVYNFIEILPDTFPSKLKKINLFYNQIETSETHLFSVLPQGLTHLNVSYQRSGKFKKLPILPSSLIELVAQNNSIELLPQTLPVNLKLLNVNYNRISALSAGLDTSALVSLNAANNLITQIVSLPPALEILNLSSNKITTIQITAFPSALIHAYVSGNKISILPVLNSNLEILNVNLNKLTTLPTLPSKLKTLDASNNLLAALPALPASLQNLYVYNNAITSIVSFPESLQIINVSKNQLTSLPTLPALLSDLYVENNLLSILPTLPSNLLSLNISKNQFAGTLNNLPLTLKALQCDSNAITSIVLPLPSNLEILTFSKNSVTVFPLATIPNTIYKLHCASNGLESIPQLTEGINEIKAKGNAFTCLPNLPLSLGSTDIRIICNKNCWIPESGNWNVASNWSMGQVPINTTDVIILNAIVQIPSTANVRNLDIRSSDFLGSGVLNVFGNINNISSYFYDGEVKMSGTTSQLITEARHSKLTINNAAGVKIGSVLHIDELSVPLGFIENNNFIQNIRVGRLGYCHSGAIVKNTSIEVNAYANSGWLFLSNNATNQQFDVLAKSVSLGFGANQTAYKYNGQLTANNGWVPVAGLNESFTPGTGYRVFSYKGSVITFAGTPFTGTKNFNVSFNSTGYDGGGWNLVGNPYMSPIDWETSTGWDKLNVDDAVYVYNSNSGKYASYVNGAKTLGGSNIIAIGQAFFVKANAANPNLQISENAKTAGYSVLLRTSETPSLTIVLSDKKQIKDEIVLRVVEGSTNKFDSNFDAYKLIGEGHNVSISGADKLPLSISSIPLSSGTYPLEIEAEKTGTYTFSFEGIEKFDATDVYLEDTYLNKSTLIQPGTLYSFNLESTIDAARFRILLADVTTGYQDAQQTGSMKVYPNPTKDNARVVFSESISGELVLTNASGEVVYTNTLTNMDSFTVPMENYSGIYFLKIHTGESVFVTKIVKL